MDYSTAICFLQHPTADPCLWLLCFKSPHFLLLVRNLASLQRMFRKEIQVRITPTLNSPASSPQPLLFHVISVRAVGCQEEEAFSGSSGLIDMPFRQQRCQESNYCPQGVAAEAAKTFLSGRRVFPFPWFQILLLFSPVSAVAPAANSREAQLPQQVWSR